MTAVFVPVAEQAAVDGGMAAAAAAAAPAVATVGAVGAVVAGGAIVDYTLLHWKPWNAFWGHVGANVENWYHSASDFLFGAVGAVTMTDVHALVQLSLAGANKLSRELFVQASAAAHAGIRILAVGVDHVRLQIHNLALSVTHLVAADVATLLHAEAYTQTLVRGAVSSVLADAHALDLRVANDVETWVRTDVMAPTLREIGRVSGRVDALAGGLGELIRTEAEKLVNAKTAALGAALAALGVSVASIATEITECVEPMCQVAGPRTDLGKLLSKLSVFKWAAILAALEATNVEDLEKLAAAVAGGEAKVGEWVASHVLDALVGEHG